MFLLGRIACTAQMRPIATDVARSTVCLSVCWAQDWALQKLLNRSRCRLGNWLGWAKRTM